MRVTKWTWDDVVKAASGKVFHDEYDEGLRFIIMRGPFHLCAYIGVPLSHPAAGLSGDDVPVNAHGGFTFAREGEADSSWPDGLYWYGWDYGHCDDYMISSTHSASYAKHNEKHKKWGVKEVLDDSWGTLYEFKKLMRLSEQIFNKARGASSDAKGGE